MKQVKLTNKNLNSKPIVTPYETFLALMSKLDLTDYTIEYI